MKTRYYVDKDRSFGWNVRDRNYRHVIVERFTSREAARRAARLMEMKHLKEHFKEAEKTVRDQLADVAYYKEIHKT